VALASALGLGVASLALERAPARPQVAPVPLGREGSGVGIDGTTATPAAEGALPVERWSQRFAALVANERWDELLAELEGLERRRPEAYHASHLGYLHARAALEAGATAEAGSRLAPYVAGGPFRPLALHHAATLAAARGRGEEAAAHRRELLLTHPSSPYWAETLREQLEWSTAHEPPEATLRLVAELLPAAEGRERRDLEAARVAALWLRGDREGALEEGLARLERSTRDDAAERVAEVLDRPEALRAMPAEGLVRLAETLQHHRRWDRAIELFQVARRGLPSRQAAELDFAVGRCHYFAERYRPAREAYLRAAGIAGSHEDRARYLFHAGRAAQLEGAHEEAERLLTRAIAVPGSHAATSAALVGRLRARVARGDLELALRDLQLLRRHFPRDRALAEGSVAFAMGEIAAGRSREALSTLGKVNASRLSEPDRAEVAYWRGRALEASALDTRALDAYLEVLRSPAATPFATFARRRLAEGELAAASAERTARLRAEARRALAAGDAAAARPLQTDVVLLSAELGSGAGEGEDLTLLASIYRAMPEYRRFLELAPRPLPRLPLTDPGRDELLAALGLFDEAASFVSERYPLAEPESALTRSLAHRLGGASRASIQAAESLARQVPGDFVPRLLPRLLRELVYPRYFHATIEAEAERAGADPRLVLAIMREESRFNPRAKSGAAARGLMQLILSTAREVAWDLGLVEVRPQDLYDPQVVIRLGAQYVGDLQRELGGDLYATAAAYNAGPSQAHVWRRLTPAPGPDFFLSTIGFQETRGYVRKVLDSYERYAEIYDGAPGRGTVEAGR
jgi:soluble lytic murein transglycosylase